MISVVIPTCDREKFLDKSVKSVLNQKTKANEIIIVNNGKKKIDNQFKNKSIKIINTLPHIGPAKARNIGARKAKYEFIIFLDDDDVWSKNYLQIVKKEIKKKSSDCYITRSKNLLKKNQYYKNPKNLIKLNHLFLYNPGIGGSNIIVKKKLINQINFDDKLVPSEDKGLIIDFLIKKKKISVINNAFVYRSLTNDYERISNLSNYIKGKIAVYNKYKNKIPPIVKMKSLIVISRLILKKALQKIW